MRGRLKWPLGAAVLQGYLNDARIAVSDKIGSSKAFTVDLAAVNLGADIAGTAINNDPPLTVSPGPDPLAVQAVINDTLMSLSKSTQKWIKPPAAAALLALSNAHTA